MKTLIKQVSLSGLFFGALLLIGCTGGNGPASAATQMEIVPGVGVGPIKLGMPMDEVKKALGEPDRLPGKPLQYSSLGLAVVPSSADGTVGAIMMGDTEGGILVERFKGATKAGIGMKSTREQIVTAYGPPQSVPDVLQKQENLDDLRYDSGKTQYKLKDGRVVHITLRR